MELIISIVVKMNHLFHLNMLYSWRHLANSNGKNERTNKHTHTNSSKICTNGMEWNTHIHTQHTQITRLHRGEKPNKNEIQRAIN